MKDRETIAPQSDRRCVVVLIVAGAVIPFALVAAILFHNYRAEQQEEAGQRAAFSAGLEARERGVDIRDCPANWKEFWEDGWKTADGKAKRQSAESTARATQAALEAEERRKTQETYQARLDRIYPIWIAMENELVSSGFYKSREYRNELKSISDDIRFLRVGDGTFERTMTRIIKSQERIAHLKYSRTASTHKYAISEYEWIDICSAAKKGKMVARRWCNRDGTSRRRRQTIVSIR